MAIGSGCRYHDKDLCAPDKTHPSEIGLGKEKVREIIKEISRQAKMSLGSLK